MKKYMIGSGIGILLVLVMAACSSSTATTETPRPEDDRVRILKQDGVKDPVLGGIPLWGCGKDDSMFFNSEFTGTKNGQHVEGYICGAFFKGYTIRYK